MSATIENKKTAWVSQLEKLINKALQLDEETRYSLAQLTDKVIAFEFSNTNLILFLFPTEQGLMIDTVYQEKPNVLIKGTPGNFVMMMTAAKRGAASMPAEMQVIGDIGLAQRFQQIMQSIEIDLEEPLSRWVGDTAAYQIGKFFRNSRRFALNATKILATDVSEYLRFETEMLPDDLLVEAFCNDVDLLREDVDRLTQRINKLETQTNNKKDENN